MAAFPALTPLYTQGSETQVNLSHHLLPLKMFIQLDEGRGGNMRRATGFFFSKSTLLFTLQMEKLRPRWGKAVPKVTQLIPGEP